MFTLAGYLLTLTGGLLEVVGVLFLGEDLGKGLGSLFRRVRQILSNNQSTRVRNMAASCEISSSMTANLSVRKAGQTEIESRITFLEEQVNSLKILMRNLVQQLNDLQRNITILQKEIPEKVEEQYDALERIRLPIRARSFYFLLTGTALNVVGLAFLTFRGG
jgi:chromosome segregation ATPase